MNMTISRRRGAMAAIIALLVTFGATAPASAATLNNCADGYMCLWRDTSYKTNGLTSDNIRLQAKIPNLTSYNWAAGGSANDSVTSITNNGMTSDAYVYTNASGGGSALPVAKGDGRPNLIFWDPSFNDTISSAKFVGVNW